MAIDTAEKRRSASGTGLFILGPGVTPDASKGVDWRQQAAWSYSGIEAEGSQLETTLFFATKGARGDLVTRGAR